MTPQTTETAAVETTPPNGIKGLASAESWWTPEHVLVVALPIAVILFTSWLLLVWLGRRKSKSALQETAVDPWSALGRTIDGLTLPVVEHASDPSAWTAFSSDVSLSARQVLADATGSACDDWTTDECAVKLQHWRGPVGLEIGDVLQLLRETDLVRFAERRPPESAALWRDKLKEWYRIRDQQKQVVASVPSSLEPKFPENSDKPTPPTSILPSSEGGIRVFD